MKTIRITNTRKNTSAVIDQVKINGEVFNISHQDAIDVSLIPLSHSFDFLHQEPDIYSISDLKKKYL